MPVRSRTRSTRGVALLLEAISAPTRDERRRHRAALLRRRVETEHARAQERSSAAYDALQRLDGVREQLARLLPMVQHE